jgi:hypothetical protein
MTARLPRSLSADERKAAEAAFRGLPFNPTWSEAARIVYDGIALVMACRRADETLGKASVELELVSLS